MYGTFTSCVRASSPCVVVREGRRVRDLPPRAQSTAPAGGWGCCWSNWAGGDAGSDCVRMFVHVMRI